MLYKFFPKTAVSMEAESRQWMLQCNRCGNEQSYWDIGGVRWKAYSKGKVVGMRCPACGKFSGHRVYRKHTTDDGSTA
jgi:hypothetical protein